MSFPAGPHAVLGLEVIFFFSMAFVTHFLPNFCKTILSRGQPVLMHKATMGFLVVYSKKTFSFRVRPAKELKVAYLAYWILWAFDVSCLPLATPWVGEVGMRQAAEGRWEREKKQRI